MTNFKQFELKNFSCRYHRNGAGDGFYLCKFTHGRRENAVDLLAVVYPTHGEIAVISADGDITKRYRGHNFETALRESIAGYEHEYPKRVFDYDNDLPLIRAA